MKEANKKIRNKNEKAKKSKTIFELNKELKEGSLNSCPFQINTVEYTSMKNPLEQRLNKISEEICDQYETQIEIHLREIKALEKRKNKLLKKKKINGDMLRKLIQLNDHSSLQIKTKIKSFFGNKMKYFELLLNIKNKIHELRMEKTPKIKSDLSIA